MSIRLSLISVAIATALASAAVAQDRVATEVFVPTAGVDFSDTASTQAFYASLRVAAVQACASGMDRDLQMAALDRRCAAQSLDGAVQKLGRASLMALHSETLGRPAPAIELAAQ